jgi:DNA invertase Pin-like site-specific DNA recombinase
MNVIGYIRVSTDQQDLEKQRHLLLEYAHQHQYRVQEFIEVQISSQKDQHARKINELLEKLKKDDVLLVAELSRLGRNMLETLNIIQALSDQGIKIIFVRQPELSTLGGHAKLLLAIYSYFAESEREYIAMRTKQGLAAAKAQGKLLGRPLGSKNKKGSRLSPLKADIERYVQLGLSVQAIKQLVNGQLSSPMSYNAVKYFVQRLAEA